MSEVSGVLGGALSGAGTLGAPAGIPSGLAGLFAMLLGQGAGSGGLGAGTGDPVAGLLAELQAHGDEMADAELLKTLGLPADMTMSQETVVMQAVLVQIRVTISELQQAGVKLDNLGDSADLAAALTKLGMDPEEAAGKAVEIDQMLQLVRDYLGANEDATTSELLAMVEASGLLTPLTGPAAVVTQTEVRITTVEVSNFTAAASVGAAKAFGKQAPGADLARVMTGIQDKLVAEDEALADNVTEPELLLDGVSDAHKKDKLPVEAVVKTDTPAVVVTVAAAAADLPKAPTKSSKDEPKIESVVSGSKAGTIVEPERVALPPEGTEVMRVRADADGNEVTERKLDAATLRNMNQDSAAQVTQDLGPQGLIADKMLAAAEGKPEATFAEKLAQATRADVTQQAVVQVKNVIDGGGGTVRIILNPPELGEIRVEMTISNGKVEGAISATDNAVVELLARDVHSLKQGLADAGLKLGDQGLALMLNNGNQNNPHGQQGQQNAHAGNTPHGMGGVSEEALAAEAAQNAATWVAPDKLVDVRI